MVNVQRLVHRWAARSLPPTDAALIALTCFVTAAPPVVDLLRHTPARRLFSFCAADTFYYLTVARNVAQTGLVSFDGEYLTNGFHPLWQVVTAFVALVLRAVHAGDIWLLGATFALGVLFTTLATLLLGLALRRNDTGLTAAFVLLPAGAASLVLMPFMQHFYGDVGRPSTTLWGAVNGMETSIVLTAYAACALSYVRAPRTPWGGFVLGSCLGLLALARLDHGLISAAIAASLLVLDRRNRKFVLAAIGTPAVILGVYLAANRLWFGMALPVSGVLKSMFPHPQDDGYVLILRLFLAPRTLIPTYAHRALQLAIPAIAAVATLLVGLGLVTWRAVRGEAAVRSTEGRRIEGLLLSTAAGVLGLFAYNYLFVPARNQGHWYFPVSHLFVSLVMIEGLRKVLNVVPGGGSARAKAGLAGAIAVGSLFGYRERLAHGDRERPMATFFFDEAPRIRAFYGARPVRLLEFDDGIITFSTGIPAMSGMGLAVDPGAFPAAVGLGSGPTDRSWLVELGLFRGYDRFATLVYSHGPVTRSSTSRQIRDAYGGFLGGQARRCDFEVEYLSVNRAFAIVHALCPKRLYPKASSPLGATPATPRP